MLQQILISFTAVFVALDVIGTVPVYVAMTQAMTDVERKQALNRSMLVAFVVAVLFVICGQMIFRFLGIELFDFKIAGGLILLLVALADLIGGPEAMQKATGSTGIVPLAVPLITGPGVLTTLILQVGTAGIAITMAALVANYFLGWIILRQSGRVTEVVGKDGTVVLSKIAALLMAAIAVAMIRGGIFESILAAHMAYKR